MDVSRYAHLRSEHHADLFEALFLSAATVVGSNFTLVIQPWQTYLFFLAISTVAIMINIFGYRILDRWNEGACEAVSRSKKHLRQVLMGSSVLVVDSLHRHRCYHTGYFAES